MLFSDLLLFALRFCHFVKDSQESLRVFQQGAFKSPSEVRRRKLCFEIKKKFTELRKKHNLTQLNTLLRNGGLRFCRVSDMGGASARCADAENKGKRHQDGKKYHNYRRGMDA